MSSDTSGWLPSARSAYMLVSYTSRHLMAACKELAKLSFAGVSNGPKVESAGVSNGTLQKVAMEITSKVIEPLRALSKQKVVESDMVFLPKLQDFCSSTVGSATFMLDRLKGAPVPVQNVTSASKIPSP